MIEYVYVLTHSYEYGKNLEYIESKMLGVYSSIESVKKAIEKYSILPGFKDYPAECFIIDKYKINEMKWTEGFVHTN